MKQSLSFTLLCLILFSLPFLLARTERPDADKLWRYISAQSPYPKWKRWQSDVEELHHESSHTIRHRVYVNDSGQHSTNPPVSYGTVIVKENIKDEEIVALTVMQKVKDYNPEGGDWFWAKYSPDGQAEISGRIKGCIGCHRSAVMNDFIFIHKFQD